MLGEITFLQFWLWAIVAGLAGLILYILIMEFVREGEE